jgi:hypothetical protein
MNAVLVAAMTALAGFPPEPTNSVAGTQFRFASPAEVARTLAVIDQTMSPEARGRELAAEERQYKVRARWLGLPLPAGSMACGMRVEEFEGRRTYHLFQHISVWGRYQDEDAWVDVDGLRPREYRLKTRRPFETDRTHVVQWDHAAGLAYLSKERLVEKDSPDKRRREVRTLGAGESPASRDALSAMLIYSLKCKAVTNIVSWTAPILMSCDDRYIMAAGAPTNALAAPRNLSGSVASSWRWIPLASTAARADVIVWFDFAARHNPRLYTMRVWGTEGSAELIEPEP